MKIAVPITAGRVSAHFGHCEQFALIDVDMAANTIVRKDLVASPGHQPGFLPGWLAGEGVSAVIAGGMGIRAQELFRDNHIQVIIGALGDDPEKIVLAHLNGTLATGENVCDH